MPKAAEVALLLAAFAAAPLAAQEPRAAVVTGLHFEGNKVLDDLVLAAAIATSASSWNYTWFGSGLTRHIPVGTRRTLDELEFRRDAVRLVLFYRQNGYYDARVDTSVVRRRGDVEITFRITEGPPVLIDSIAIRGVEAISDAGGFPRRLLIGPGRPFNRFLFEASTDTLVRLMRDRGYPFAQVFRSYEVDRATRLAAVTFDVDPGPRARVGAILLEGNERVSARTIRRSLTFQEGQYFSHTALIESQRSLYQSDLFRYVNVAVAPDSLVDGRDSLVRVRIQLAEAEPLSVRAGIGYGTIDCFRFSSTLTKRNFLGGARQLDLTGRLSKLGLGTPLGELCPAIQEDPFSQQVNYLADVTVTQPSTWFKRTTIALSGFSERRSEFNAYLTESVGAALAMRFGFGRRVPPLSLTYRISNDVTDAAPATYCSGIL